MFPLILLWDFSIYCVSICKRGSPGFQVNNDVHEIITFYFLRKTPSSIDKNELTKKLPGSCREIICFVIRDSTPVLAREMKCDIQSVKRDTPSIWGKCRSWTLLRINFDWQLERRPSNLVRNVSVICSVTPLLQWGVKNYLDYPENYVVSCFRACSEKTLDLQPAWRLLNS